MLGPIWSRLLLQDPGDVQWLAIALATGKKPLAESQEGPRIPIGGKKTVQCSAEVETKILVFLFGWLYSPKIPQKAKMGIFGRIWVKKCGDFVVIPIGDPPLGSRAVLKQI